MCWNLRADTCQPSNTSPSYITSSTIFVWWFLIFILPLVVLLRIVPVFSNFHNFWWDVSHQFYLWSPAQPVPFEHFGTFPLDKLHQVDLQDGEKWHFIWALAINHFSDFSCMKFMPTLPATWTNKPKSVCTALFCLLQPKEPWLKINSSFSLAPHSHHHHCPWPCPTRMRLQVAQNTFSSMSRTYPKEAEGTSFLLLWERHKQKID